MSLSAMPTGHVEVRFSKFLRRYQIGFVDGCIFAGSRDAMDLVLYRMNKLVRPRKRGLHNPTRSSKRTDFGRRFA